MDGLLLARPAASQDELDRALAAAPIERLRVALRPG
jgi:hypothetical protein